MSVARWLVAAALIAHGGSARADDAAIASNAQEITVAVGVGSMTTSGSLGDQTVAGWSFSGSWYPGNGHLGARLQLSYAAVDAGTTYVHSERSSNQLAAFATARHHVAGPLFGFAGIGAGAVVIRSRHRALADERVLWTSHPALTWTAGVELVLQQVFVRADHVGAWYDLSRDTTYSVHVGMAF